MSEIVAVALVLFGLSLLALLTSLFCNFQDDGWRPFQQHHSADAYYCPRWQWIWQFDWTRPCYHETPDGPRCCNCGLKPPKDKPEHGNKIKE